MILTHFPPSWTESEREVYLRWSASEAPLSPEEEIILASCFERMKKGERPWAELAEDPIAYNEQYSMDPYHLNNAHRE